ncbi:hypothetical protein [Leptospira borgpetersenii]|uniref:Uncharacterized protein n=1 Tax=Leptospira borgpetersenii serovar Ballum TaxID=280505 RepID=A0A0E3B557_LEPBO|nr:hypothetical protein [Leptospira borgpetersenii]EMO08434.1 hypothetical protein LEP1GSC137_3201 [Leptospira borgpetersenii str. Noumea 25]ALO28128.1 hypothetical protein LBBP_03974 [Leptospira borgpetersenii serovar Ballum]EKR00910.1 hypothetical protein LEP1GSC121_0223 [Leptospira borgpetersenii serovar Castellonis str. 200801910]KGE26420.1 hypothetical protein IQ66_00925 [Leptospira borgpetersenii serovar Ballum]OOV43502.1 hypothetical protein B1H38_12095 [Leptospira borgpetersenii serova
MNLLGSVVVVFTKILRQVLNLLQDFKFWDRKHNLIFFISKSHFSIFFEKYLSKFSILPIFESGKRIKR